MHLLSSQATVNSSLMSVHTSLIAELESAISVGTRDKRVETLRRVTDLFLDSTDRFNDTQIDLFDDVLCHLIKRMEARALSELSRRLAPVENAPPEVIRTLARDDFIVVAGPVLAQSTRLTSKDLIDVANTKSRAHLLAISERTHLEEEVTDALLSHEDGEVANRLAKNAGARFSELGVHDTYKASRGGRAPRKKDWASARLAISAIATAANDSHRSRAIVASSQCTSGS